MAIYYYLAKYLIIYTVCEIFSNLPFFETWICLVIRVPETQVSWTNSLQVCCTIFNGTQVTSKNGGYFP